MKISQIKNHFNLNKHTYFKGITPEKVGKLARGIKTQFILSDLSPIASFKAIRLFNENPRPVMYGLVGHINDVLNSHGKIGEIQIPLRKGGKKLNASVMKYCFNNEAQRYSIRRLGETLAYVDTVLEDSESLYIKYLCNIQGRKKFRGLEQKVLQAAIEDTINQKGIIPEITAVAENIGNAGMDRATLYKYMGAEEVDIPIGKRDDNFVFIKQFYCAKEAVIRKLDKIAKRDGFIFPQTKEIFEKLK